MSGPRDSKDADYFDEKEYVEDQIRSLKLLVNYLEAILSDLEEESYEKVLIEEISSTSLDSRPTSGQ